MDVSGDELAGVVDLFGALTRRELERALEELAFKRGEDVAGGTFAGEINASLDSYHLVAVEPEHGGDDETGTGAGDGDGDEPADGDRDTDRAGDADGDGDGNRDAEPLLVPGPVAFPALPEGAEDLPHIMDIDGRTVDRERAGAAALDRLRADAAAAIQSGDNDRVAELLDVSYDLETWAPVELDGVRDHLDGAATE